MPPILPLCPYCKERRLARADYKTCGTRSCRGKRSRALAKANKTNRGKDSPYTPEVRDIAMEAARGANNKDIAVAATREVAREVVREAMTQDIIEALQGMVLLVPAAKEALEEDLKGDDPVARQRAYELVFRYTMGNKSIAPPPKEEAAQPMQVILNIPGSGAQLPANGELPVPAEAVEVRECMECGEMKTEFVANSDRCTDCHNKVMKRIEERFGQQ
jgi:hypothetical protein